MRRLVICLLLMMLPCAALANGWGAPGTTVELFDGNREYSDYSCIANDYTKDGQTVRLVMNSRYHNQLLCAELADGHWRVKNASTTAVYQPGHEKAEKVSLDRYADGFTLFYPDEEYEFSLSGGEYVLSNAQVGDLSFSWSMKGVEVYDDQSTVLWQVGEYWNEDAWVTLDAFNIELLPRSTDEVRRMNAVRALIAGGGELLGEPIMESADETLPVYSAPSEKSWRASDGKASVNLRDTNGLFSYGEIDGWEMIEYQVSLRTSRIGYIHRDSEPLVVRPPRVPVVTVAETYLTDDPNVSQFRQMTIPADAPLTALSCYGPFYVYVETELDGQAIRGFVPMRDLKPAELPAASVDQDALVGAWLETLEDRVDMAGRYLALGEIGLFTGYRVMSPGKLTAMDMDERAAGRWYVRSCPEGLFENQYSDVLILLCDNGKAYCMGLALEDGVLKLDQSETAAHLDSVKPGRAEKRQDVMEEIAGCYQFEAGGTHLPEGELILNADGTASGSNGFTSTWYLTNYSPAEGYIWNNPPYTAYFELGNGATLRLGCLPSAIEGSAYVGAQRLIFSDGEGSGGYLRSDLDVAMMEKIAGNYALVSTGTLLTEGRLRLHPQGYFYSEQGNRDAMSGLWRLTRSDDAYAITFLVNDRSLAHAGETLTYDCAFTPASGDEPATIVLTDGEVSDTYTWDEEAGNG